MKWIVIGLLLLGITICAGCTSSNSPSSPLVTTPVTQVEPNLVGNWMGTFTGYIDTAGYQVFQEPMTLTIVEQSDRLFKGRVTYPLNGTMVTKDVAGALSLDGRSFKTIEYPSGFSDGIIISADEIEMIYRDTTDPSKIAIDTLTRIT
ncbi:MAG TPA: hypothetical protein PLV88_03670 [Methanoregulaceae archaeon]|jgi:hypothetical protein|nr:hypothetical protein [Methanoregulaceae archaeon]MCC7469498.1 hypothetical protein [Burkholderiaceae bacterium]NLH26711.1 hypothetical protein [Methanomicrobiales archaeon]HNB03368.1 hypothetical protein [Methanoregulaceae archaeon]HNI41799.1 hypothetical protein [Methanoregulaceae archaeon]